MAERCEYQVESGEQCASKAVSMVIYSHEESLGENREAIAGCEECVASVDRLNFRVDYYLGLTR